MGRLIILILFLISAGNAFATTYYVCGTQYWDGAPAATNNFFYTTSNCSGSPTDPTFLDGDEVVVTSTATLIVTGNLTISTAIKITVEGKFYMQENPGAGNINLTNSSSTIELKSGSEIGCWDKNNLTPSACSNSDQITIGPGGSSFTWKGGAIDDLTSPNILTNTGLPIVLLYFNVSIPKNENHALIEWATEEELNFDHFEIQRSGKDLQFATILEEPGAGYNTNSIQKYSASDENPLVGTGYYRLKAVDIDGTYEYFKIKSVNYNGNRKLLVSPNPVSGTSIKYTLNFDPGPYDRVTLINQVGTELISTPVTAIENEIILDSKLRPGAYLLRYSSPAFQYVARVFIKD